MEDICDRLRAAGITCGWRNEVDPTRFMGIGGLAGSETRFEVYVDELELEHAQRVLGADDQEGALRD